MAFEIFIILTLLASERFCNCSLLLLGKRQHTFDQLHNARMIFTERFYYVLKLLTIHTCFPRQALQIDRRRRWHANYTEVKGASKYRHNGAILYVLSGHCGTLSLLLMWWTAPAPDNEFP